MNCLTPGCTPELVKRGMFYLLDSTALKRRFDCRYLPPAGAQYTCPRIHAMKPLSASAIPPAAATAGPGVSLGAISQCNRFKPTSNLANPNERHFELHYPPPSPALWSETVKPSLTVIATAIYANRSAHSLTVSQSPLLAARSRFRFRDVKGIAPPTTPQQV